MPSPSQPPRHRSPKVVSFTHYKLRAACLLAQFAPNEADHNCLLHLLPGDAIPPAWRSTFRLYEWASQHEHVVVYGEHTRRFEVLPACEAADTPQDDERWARALRREIEARQGEAASA